MNLLFYHVFRYYFTFWLTILYRTFIRINKQNVPAEGPVIIYANHRNLFIDGVVFLLLTKQSITGIDRVVRVITAARSIKRPGIGHYLKMAGVIGV